MSVESEQDLLGLKEAGKIVARTLRELKRSLRPGMTTADVDSLCAEALARQGARPAPQMFYGFPGSLCISVNDEVVHGVPGKRVLRAGDLVKLDVTAERNGYIADAAITVALPPVSPLKRRLCAAESALYRAIDVARTGRPLNEIGRAVETEVRRHGLTVLRDLSGHGVGRAIHEAPAYVLNYYDRRLTEPLTEGLVIAIEPMVSAGAKWVVDGGDGWTYKTEDGSLAAHFEHTVMVARDRAVVLTVA